MRCPHTHTNPTPRKIIQKSKFKTVLLSGRDDKHMEKAVRSRSIIAGTGPGGTEERSVSPKIGKSTLPAQLGFWRQDTTLQ